MELDSKGLETWQKIGIACLLIIIPGFIGWCVEYFFAWYDNGMTEFYYKGGNFLPWINMYSIGAFLIFLFTYKFRKNPWGVLFVSILVCGIFEFLTGLVLDKCFQIRFWDYKNEILNIYGYVCLLSLAGFGIGGIFLMYLLLPYLVKLSKRIPKKVFLTLSIGFCSLILCDELYNLLITRIFDLPTAQEVYTSIGIKYLPK